MCALSYVSMKSFRTSSLSKRLSDYSIPSSTKSSSSEIASTTVETTATTTSSNSSSDINLQQQTLEPPQQQQNILITTTNASNTTLMIDEQNQEMITKSSTPISSSSSSSTTTELQMTNASSVSPDHFTERERDKQLKPNIWPPLDKTSSLDRASLDGITQPPALPPKTGGRQKERQTSLDEIDDANSLNDFAELRPHHYEQRQQQHHVQQWQTKHQSLMEPPRNVGFASSCNALITDGVSEEPPPLPMKKKHILAYMEICSATSHRHTMHTYNPITHSQTMNVVTAPKELSLGEEAQQQVEGEHVTPPALPPKNYKRKLTATPPPTIITTPPPSPKITNSEHARIISGAQYSEMMTTVCEEVNDINEEDQVNLRNHSHYLPNIEVVATIDDNAGNRMSKHHFDNHNNHNLADSDCVYNEEDILEIDVDNNLYNKKGSSQQNNLPNILEEIDIMPYLVLKKDGEDGPEVKGGYIDALIVHASRATKCTNNAFTEAFITTFRTFIQPIDLIEKLIHRYTIFFCQLNDPKQKAAKETFSLLGRVVNDLTSTELTKQLLALLVEFVYQLVCAGNLYLAKYLRNNIVEKVSIYKEQKLPIYQMNMNENALQISLLDLKSIEIAEQMTLLDAELFQKIEIPEVLLFAKEQCEEKSPNLNKFTEHFNKMSYWARSKILMLTDAKEREKHVVKFIKIMKHLRKMNNYNSYLALLSALDSAPIRRLEWHKTITEGLKEYCTLIDSSSSFRVYRQALAETNPPCIPYIGLVLQDLTFVHVGNVDYLREGVINFSKRWQQHNIIVNMKRFKKCSYNFKRNERIIHYFDNFEKFLGEEEMWQISETIKPRGKRNAN